MDYLKDSTCERCKGTNILVLPYTLTSRDAEVKETPRLNGTQVVGNAYCIDCLKPIIVPSEPYRQFTKQHCYQEKER